MIKPESNAPSPMKPWVRTTDKQIENLESAIARVESVLGVSSGNIDYELNQGLTNTFSFTPIDDGSTETTSGAMSFTGNITSDSNISLAGTLIVGDPSRQEYNESTGESIGQIPTLEVVAGQVEINPVTEIEYYTTGQINTTDTTFNVNGYGSIAGDGMQITLSNNGEVERQNIEILDVVGSGTEATFEIENNTSNVAVYTAGKYVNISGVDPDGYNGTNLLITSVNTGVSPMTFTVASEETGTYVAGGYVTINQPNSIYEGKLSVQGPAPEYTGVTIDQNGVHIGTNGGDPAASDVLLDSTGLTAPSAFIDQAVINGTRLFISDTAPTAVNDGDIWIDKVGIFTGSSGTVTSVGMTVPTGLTVSPSSITTSGTFAVDFGAGYSIPTTTAQQFWNTAYNERAQWDGGSTNLVASTGRTSLGATTAGSNFFTLANPSAITFPRINADNTVSALDAATFRTAIGAASAYTLPKATPTTLGGVELFDIAVAGTANAVSTTAGRTYGSQLNSADQLVINVPWTDTLGYIGSFQTTAASSSAAITLAPTSVATSPAAAISVIGGATTNTAGVAGGVNVTGGAATTGTNSATGGSVAIRGGSANTTNGIGGSVAINGGQGSTANGNGFVQIGTTTTDGVTIGASLSLTNGISGALNLNNASSPLQVQGSAGATGQVLTSAGAGATPTWGTVSGAIKIATGRTTSTTGTAALAVNTGETIGIPFPSGRFSSSPSVTVTTSSPRYVAAATVVTASGFTLSVRNVSDATGTTYLYHWQAIEVIS